MESAVPTVSQTQNASDAAGGNETGSSNPVMSPATGNHQSNSATSTVKQHQSQQEQSLAAMMGHSEIFSVDGIHYNVANSDHSGYTAQELGVFTCADLYAVMDQTNSAGTVTEVTDGSNWQDCFYPIGSSDIRQLQTSGTSGDMDSGNGDLCGTETYPTNGSFFRLISLHGTGTPSNIAAESNVNIAGSFTAEAGSNTTDGGCSDQSPESGGNSSAAGTASTTAQLGNQNVAGDSQLIDVPISPAAGVVKTRKPRGRKPKHVKEAEAAAAAALAAVSGNSGEPKASSPNGSHGPGGETTKFPNSGKDKMATLEDRTATPSITIHHRGNTSQSQQQPGGVFPNATISSPYAYHYQTNGGCVNSPQQQLTSNAGQGAQQSQMSLEQLACNDRRLVLNLVSRRRACNGLAPKSSQQYQQHHLAQGCHPHHHNNASCSPNHAGIQNHPVPSNNISSPHPHYANNNNVANSSGRLEQFFSSRIAAPSNRSIVKPKIIQENRTIYNLLTAPTTPLPGASEFENRKFSQERWMQCPNPSVLSEDTSNIGSAGDSGSQNMPMNQSSLSHMMHNKQGSTSSLFQYQDRQYTPQSQNYQSSQQPLADQSSRFIIGNSGRVNIRRDSDYNGGTGSSNNNNNTATTGRGYHHSFYNSQGSTSSPSVSSRGNSVSVANSSSLGYLMSRHELQQRVETLLHEKFELQCRAQYQFKVNKMLLYRLREAYEELEHMRTFNEIEFSKGGGGAGDHLSTRPFHFSVNTANNPIRPNLDVHDTGSSNATKPDVHCCENEEDNFVKNSGGGRQDCKTPWKMQMTKRSANLGDESDEVYHQDEELSPASASGDIGCKTSSAQGKARGDLKRRSANTDFILLDGYSQHSKKLCGFQRDVNPGKSAPAKDNATTKNGITEGVNDDTVMAKASNEGGNKNKHAGQAPSESALASLHDDTAPHFFNTGTENGNINNISPSAETERVIADDGENTCSTLFNSPCSVSSHFGGSASKSTSCFQSIDFSAINNTPKPVGVLNPFMEKDNDKNTVVGQDGEDTANPTIKFTADSIISSSDTAAAITSA